MMRRMLTYTLMCIGVCLGNPAIIGGVIGGTSSVYIRRIQPIGFYSVTTDSSFIQESALDSLKQNLGANFNSESPRSVCYTRYAGFLKAYDYCFEFDLLASSLDTTLLAKNGLPEMKISQDQALMRYGFSVQISDGSYTDQVNLVKFINSAYHQEVIPGYKNIDSLFREPPPHSQFGLWLRGSLSMGWATGYLQKDNPFATSGALSFVKVLLYAIDGIVLAGMISTAVGADNDKDRWQKPLFIKAGHSALSLGIFMPLLSLELGETIKIRESGYRFPKDMSFY